MTPTRPTATSPGDAPTPGASPILAEAARLVREAVRDKRYQLTPIGADAAGYLRAKRKRLTDSSYRDYECCLDKLARHFLDLRIEDFEPPAGTERIEEFLDALWGSGAPRTYNKNLPIIKDFFRFQIMRGRLHGDPTLLIERARSQQVYRTTFSTSQRRAIITEQTRPARPAVPAPAARLRPAQGRAASGPVQALRSPAPPPDDLHEGPEGARAAPPPPRLLARPRTPHPRRRSPALALPALHAAHDPPRRRVPLPRQADERPRAHDWWYRCLATAGIVAPGTTSGERMHKSRHTAGQRVLDATGNLKAVQKLLGHASIQTTGDIYADWDIDQLAATMADVLAADDENAPKSPDSQSFPPSPPQNPTICSGNEGPVETVGVEPTSAIA